MSQFYTPCNNSPVEKKHNSKVGFKVVYCLIMLPVLGAFMLAFYGIFITSGRKKESQQEEQSDINPKEFDLHAISILDGKVLYEEIIRATEDFDAAYCIGRGAVGSVYKAKLPSDDLVAVKKLHIPCDGVWRKEFLNEVRALTEIRHRNIVKLYGFCSHAWHSFLVYEYLGRGSLFSILCNDEEARKLDWIKRVNIIKGVAHGLSYMYQDVSLPIVHRDISSKNILLDTEYEARISDFGTAKILDYESSNWTVVVGTIGYIALLVFCEE